VLLGGLSASFAAGETAAPRCQAIHGETILAGDLAAANPVFAGLDPATPVGPAPMVGAQRVFRGTELARLVRENHLPAGPLHDACFEWPTAVLPAGRFAAAMARVLNLEPGAIEILEQSRFPAPSGELEFAKADLQPLPGADGRISLWRGFVRYGANRRFPVWARVRILAPVTRVVARSPLAPGQPIAATALESTVTTDGIFSGTYATSVAEIAGRVPRIRIEPGVAIRLSDVTSPPEIQAGDEVEVEVRNGAMRILLTGKAERSGRTGEIIPLVNPTSSAHFSARVEGRERAVVTLVPR
jgi:flagella basal body P-ring formation protein FlgA